MNTSKVDPMQMLWQTDAHRRPQPLKPQNRKRPLALVVEDQLLIVQTLNEILDLREIHTLAVDNSNTALALIETYVPDLVLLDVDFPGTMDCVDVLLGIRDDPLLVSTPVILLTVEDTSARSFVTEVANAVLPKPVDPGCLLSWVDRLLDCA